MFNSTLDISNAEGFQVNTEEPFLENNCKTYISGSPPLLLAPFILKKKGLVLTQKKSNLVTFVLSTRPNSNETTRTFDIALDPMVFHSKDKFVAAIRASAPEVVFALGSKVSSTILIEYFHWLHESDTHFLQKEASFVGYMEPNYWVLNDKQHIQNGKLVAEADQQYIFLDKEISDCFLHMNPELLKKDHCKAVMSRVIFLSNHLKNNQIPFIHLMAFAILRIWKLMDPEKDSAGMSKYACLTSSEKSIGKTSMQVLVARGTGVPNRETHACMVKGAEGHHGGTTFHLQQQVMSKTNLFIFTNEMDLGSATTAHNLNQSHEGMFSGGSTSRGFVSTRACVIGSSNTTCIHERLEGRVHVIKCFGSDDFSDESEAIIDNQLIPLANKQIGFILAWVIVHREFWITLKDDAKDFHPLLLRLFPTAQKRSIKCLGNTLLIAFMLLASSNEDIDILNFTCEMIKPKEKPDSFIGDFVDSLIERINTVKEAPTWLCPFSVFVDEFAEDTPVLAIRKAILSSLSVSSKKAKSVFMGFGGNATWNGTVSFLDSKDAKFTDQKDKTNSKVHKCVKLPWKIIPKEKKDILLKAMDLALDIFPDDPYWEGALLEEPGTNLLTAIDKTVLRVVYERVCTVINENGQRNTQDSEFEKNMSPNKKAEYKLMSPKSKKAFEGGFNYCIKKRRLDED